MADARDPFARAMTPVMRPRLRSLSSGPPTGVFRRIEALADELEVVAARRSSSTPPEPCPDSSEDPKVDPEPTEPSAPRSRH